ncbi:hypothetical protein QQ045_017282 [Rhodiola kirilowii]
MSLIGSDLLVEQYVTGDWLVGKLANSGAFLSRAKGEESLDFSGVHPPSSPSRRSSVSPPSGRLRLGGGGVADLPWGACFGLAVEVDGGLAFGVSLAVNRGRRLSSPADLEDDDRGVFPGGEGLRCDYAVELFPARKLVWWVAEFCAGGFDAGCAALRGMPLLAYWRSSTELAGCLGGGSLVARVKSIVSAGGHSVNAFHWDLTFFEL